MVLARDLWHYTSAQSPCLLSFCFAYFLFRVFLACSDLSFFLITLPVSVYSFMYLGFLDLHSLKLISRFGVVCVTSYSLF